MYSPLVGRLRVFTSSSGAARLAAARQILDELPSGVDALIVGASRAAADELALQVARDRGALFGVSRSGFGELAARLALPALAAEGLSPTGALGAEAVVTRVAFEARADGRLRYFAPVAGMPGFPRAAARTLHELQMAGVEAAALASLDGAGADLAALVDGAVREARRAGTVPRAGVFAAAARVLGERPGALGASAVILLDVALASPLETSFAAAIVEAASEVFATVA
ncbi:MAG: hypothetical protein AB1635_19935, partial [Acidobacteriota bacterium]